MIIRGTKLAHLLLSVSIKTETLYIEGRTCGVPGRRWMSTSPEKRSCNHKPVDTSVSQTNPLRLQEPSEDT